MQYQEIVTQLCKMEAGEIAATVPECEVLVHAVQALIAESQDTLVPYHAALLDVEARLIELEVEDQFDNLPV